MNEHSDELSEWVTDATAKGASRVEIQDRLVALGWHATSTTRMLDQVLDGGAPKAVTPSTLPEPDLRNLPTTLDVGDARVRVLMSMRKPRIVLFGDFLSGKECDELIAYANPLLQRSEIIDTTDVNGEALTSYSRTSQSAFIRPSESTLVERIEKRVARVLRWPVENSEHMQIVRYGPGADFVPHHDYFDIGLNATPKLLEQGGQRVASMLLYLNTPEKGGSTLFSDVQLEVMPKRGNALFFNYSIPHPSTLTLHGGAPVVSGEKWLATVFMRERFMHKRPE
ncbi:MAG: 2OG-Fe(II) oxygenase [Luteimonas sp.]